VVGHAQTQRFLKRLPVFHGGDLTAT
jgi:hypothetical protein